jgi:cytochrome c oxidase cbb3-type subunit 3
MIRFALACALICATGVAACEREQREFRADPAQTANLGEEAWLSASEAAKQKLAQQYEQNAYHLSQGKRLYTWFNCVGCHANGGGGSGPALMDDKWIYGAQIEDIVASILEGRPNGMPSFKNKITDEQVWQIAAYVRSMGRYVPQDAAPGRNDHMNARPAENRLPTGIPKAAPAPADTQAR